MRDQLGFDIVPRKLVRVTPARLSTWTGCPRRYRMAYLDRPAPPRGGAWAHSTLGAVVHNALRAFFELPAVRRTTEVAADLVRRYWRGEGFADAAQEADYRERAQEWVSAYVSGCGDDVQIVGLERWVSVSTDRIIAEGRVDRIDQRDGELVIVDYKTGRRIPTDEDAKTSQALCLYAVATARTMRRPCSRVELHHLPSGRVASWTHTEESLRGAIRQAEDTAERASAAADALADGGSADELFPPLTGRHCSSCEFRRGCPEGQAAAPDISPWALLAP